MKQRADSTASFPAVYEFGRTSKLGDPLAEHRWRLGGLEFLLMPLAGGLDHLIYYSSGAGHSNLRAFDVNGESVACEAGEVLVSAICKAPGGAPILQDGKAICSGSPGIVRLCMQR
jgi:hypothetical protein